MEMYVASKPSPTENICVKLQGIHHSISKQVLELFFWSNGVSFSNINYDQQNGEAQVIFTDELARKSFLEFTEMVPLKIEGHRIRVSSELPSDSYRKDDLHVASNNSPVVTRKSRGIPEMRNSCVKSKQNALMDAEYERVVHLAKQMLHNAPLKLQRPPIPTKPTVRSRAERELVHSPAHLPSDDMDFEMHPPMPAPTHYTQRTSSASLDLNTIQTPKPHIIKTSVKPSASQISGKSMMDRFTVSEQSPRDNISLKVQGIHRSVSKQDLEFFFLSNDVQISNINYERGEGEARVCFTDEHARKAFLDFSELVPLEMHGHQIYVSTLDTEYMGSEPPADSKRKDNPAALNFPVVHKQRDVTTQLFQNVPSKLPKPVFSTRPTVRSGAARELLHSPAPLSSDDISIEMHTPVSTQGVQRMSMPIKSPKPVISTRPTFRSGAVREEIHFPAHLSTDDMDFQMHSPISVSTQRTAGASSSMNTVQASKPHIIQSSVKPIASQVSKQSLMDRFSVFEPSPTENISVEVWDIPPTVSKQALEFFFGYNGVSISNIDYEPGDGAAHVICTDEYATKAFLEFAEMNYLEIEGHQVHVSPLTTNCMMSQAPTDSINMDDLESPDSPLVPKKSSSDTDDIFGGEVVTITDDQFGFIRPASQLPTGFTQKDVYFHFSNAAGVLSEGDQVSFKLDTEYRAKPKARKVWNQYENEPEERPGRSRRRGLRLSDTDASPHPNRRSRSRKAGQYQGGRPRSPSKGKKQLLQSSGTRKEIDQRMRSLDKDISSRGERTEPGENLLQKDQTECTNIRPSTCSTKKLEYVGRIVFVKDNFGFIEPYGTLPDDYTQNKGIYFTLDKVRAGHLDLISGDEVEFSLGTKNKQKPMAFNVTLISCNSRRSAQLDQYLSKIYSMVCKQDPVARKIQTEYIVSILSCSTIWHNIGRNTPFNGASLINLIEIMLELDKNVAAIPEMFNHVLKILASSALFNPWNGEFKRFLVEIHSAEPQTMIVIQDFLLMLIRRVPSKIRAVISLVKPMVSSSRNSTEYFLYSALKTIAQFSNCDIDDMEWNELPLVPTASELLRGPLEDNINLRPVKNVGPYGSPEEYMDTYFRLFRADCFDALKRGIREFLQGKLDSRDMNVFHDITLVGIRVTQQGQGLTLGLKLTPERPVKNWETCSSLMFGNLLCLSPSGTFTDPIWATVISRELLNKFSTVVVELCSETNSNCDPEAVMALQKAKGQTIAVESPTYYRAYQPIMKALQSMKPDDVPFQEELINVQTPQSPDFVNKETVVDTPVLYTGFHHQNMNVMDLCTGRSPSGTTSLDQSQETAIKTSLMQRLAIIQGPPGTGKTFVGIKLIQLLLSMSSKPSGPILVLTYKNHALDEFLKDLIKHNITNLVRVGGRCQDPDLASYNLNELRKNHMIQNELYKEISSYRTDIQNLKPEVEEAFNDLEKSKDFDAKCFIRIISDEQLVNFLVQCRWNETDVHTFKKDADSWNVVNKKGKGHNPIQVEEVKELIKSVPGSLKDLLCNEHAGELHTKMMLLVQSALNLWMPSKKSVKQFEEQLAFRFSVTKPQCPAVMEEENNAKPAKVEDDDADDEQDLEDLQQERLAADFSQKALNVGDLLKDFRLLDSSTPSTSMCSLHGSAQKLAQEEPITSLLNRSNLWSINDVERLKVVQAMLLKQFEEKSEEFQRLLTEYQRLCAVKNELENQNKANILNSKDVIGLTITGASLHHHLLMQVQPPIILVEEAAEVLEPQILAILGSWVKQIILIGDHKQLKPPVESFVLRKDFNFDTSMMERLLNNKFPYCTLRMQNRMLPEFAELLLDIYPDLQSNTQCVGKHRKAVCIDKAMYFWDHVCLETKDRSFTNEEEAERAVRLALFLIQQGNKPANITILGAYQGQVVLLRKKMKAAKVLYKEIFPIEAQASSSNKSASGDGTEQKEPIENEIKIHTIDMYQGDENEFVIISLVRCNKYGKIGFLSQLNRRCVAQSRSRCGLYFIGNRETLSQNKHWSTMISKMDKNVGHRIPLCCPRHPDVSKLEPSSAAEITLSCFCQKRCLIPMACGKHSCRKTCQPTHDHILCQERVDYTFPKCRHVHQFECFMTQNPEDLLCKEKLQFQFVECKHLGYKKCHQRETEIKCIELCPRKLPCKHPCTLKCGDPCCPDKCEQCRKIKEHEAQQMRQKEEMLRKKALEDVERQLQSLASNPDRGKVLRQLLKPDGASAEEYYDVEDRVKKYIQPGHKWFPCVTKIEKVVNVDLHERWLKAKLKMKDPTRSALKFHGTSTDATEGIIKEGFRMPKPSNQMYGAGIYFASDSSKSAQEIYTKGSNTILLCDVLLGKTFTANSAQNGMTLTDLKKRGYDSLFAKRGTKGTGGVLFDEFVVYNPDQALPVYIIHYKQSAVDTVPNIRLLELQAMGQSGIIRHNIKPKRTVNIDDPLDVHFRIAESQILRLSQRTGNMMEITSVDYYINPPLVRKFEAKSKIMQTKFGNKEESQYILAFHGTRQDNIKSIVTNNFSLSKMARGAYGAGIYFSEFPDVSRGYSQSNSLLLCRVLPGKSYDCQGPMLGAPLKHGYDSHRVKPDISGRGRELVIFDPDQILPLYVINFK